MTIVIMGRGGGMKRSNELAPQRIRSSQIQLSIVGKVGAIFVLATSLDCVKFTGQIRSLILMLHLLRIKRD
jgi:hypothetical protein